MQYHGEPIVGEPMRTTQPEPLDFEAWRETWNRFREAGSGYRRRKELTQDVSDMLRLEDWLEAFGTRTRGESPKYLPKQD